MVNMNVIDLDVVDAIIKAHPYIDAVAMPKLPR